MAQTKWVGSVVLALVVLVAAVWMFSGLDAEELPEPVVNDTEPEIDAQTGVPEEVIAANEEARRNIADVTVMATSNGISPENVEVYAEASIRLTFYVQSGEYTLSVPSADVEMVSTPENTAEEVFRLSEGSHVFTVSGEGNSFEGTIIAE